MNIVLTINLRVDTLVLELEDHKFHDIVLDCAGPLDILENKINQYIQTAK